MASEEERLLKTNGVFLCSNQNMFYVFFWVIPRRLKFICRCFETFSSVFTSR